MTDKRRKNIDQVAEAKRRRAFFEQLPTAAAELGEMVRALRSFSLLTQEEFAKKVGIAINALKQIEAGRGNPTLQTLNKIGKPFGLTVSLTRRPSRPSL